MQDILPVEPGDPGVDDFPFGATLRPRSLADQVTAFLQQQGLVAADQVDWKQLLLQVARKFLGVEPHLAFAGSKEAYATHDLAGEIGAHLGLDNAHLLRLAHHVARVIFHLPYYRDLGTLDGHLVVGIDD